MWGEWQASTTGPLEDEEHGFGMVELYKRRLAWCMKSLMVHPRSQPKHKCLSPSAFLPCIPFLSCLARKKIRRASKKCCGVFQITKVTC